MTFRILPPNVPRIKRAFDLILTIPGLIFLSPILALASLAILLQDGRPILFRQLRPGLNTEIFSLYKLRSMRTVHGKDGELPPDHLRLTRLGKFLRATSIDDLPNLFNVLRGEMSLVGPRPLLVQYLERYNSEQIRRHEVLPGITGWAQINGRNAISWEEKFALDLWYVDNWTFWLDLKILILTFWKVLKRDGISAPGEATSQEFTGSRE
jgi:sugar transferase EpsL